MAVTTIDATVPMPAEDQAVIVTFPPTAQQDGETLPAQCVATHEDGVDLLPPDDDRPWTLYATEIADGRATWEPA